MRVSENSKSPHSTGFVLVGKGHEGFLCFPVLQNDAEDTQRQQINGKPSQATLVGLNNSKRWWCRLRKAAKQPSSNGSLQIPVDQMQSPLNQMKSPLDKHRAHCINAEPIGTLHAFNIYHFSGERTQPPDPNNECCATRKMAQNPKHTSKKKCCETRNMAHQRPSIRQACLNKSKTPEATSKPQ
eukprot:1158437-Pelagomonas_calceolata.AAC.2